MKDPRPTCPACALKHISAAIAWNEFAPVDKMIPGVHAKVSYCLCKALLLMGEFVDGYEGHDSLAHGWMAVAEDLMKLSDPGTAAVIRGMRKTDAGTSVMRMLLDFLQGSIDGVRMMALAHLTEAQAEGNMVKDAPEMWATIKDLLQGYDTELARKLMMEYRKLYEL